jgi:hypothetical protein
MRHAPSAIARRSESAGVRWVRGLNATVRDQDGPGNVGPRWHDANMGFPELGAKRHAVRKGDPDSPLYWVGDDADWREIRRQPRVALECPERCGVELVSVENPAYRYTPRFFRVKPPRLPCDHWEPPPGLGGRESPEHDWLKNRLAVIARDLGYDAVVEHWPTRADVYVLSSPPFCLEIQLRPTGFGVRTRARRGAGAGICWLIRDSLNTPGATEALSRAQAVRFRVVDEGHRVVQPWRDPPDGAANGGARIEVFGRIAARPAGTLTAGESWFRADGCMDARQFLDEILSGRRRPYNGPQLGLSQAAWALDADVADYRAFNREKATRQAARPVPEQVRASGSRPLIPPQGRGERSRVAGWPDERTKAVVQARAAVDLARRIGDIEEKMAALEQGVVQSAADFVGDAYTATDATRQEADAEMGALAFQLKILRRQLALLPKQPDG